MVNTQLTHAARDSNARQAGESARLPPLSQWTRDVSARAIKLLLQYVSVLSNNNPIRILQRH
jgi:hypothetical protein